MSYSLQSCITHLRPPSPVGSLRYFVDDKTWTMYMRISRRFREPGEPGETGETSAKPLQTHFETSRNNVQRSPIPRPGLGGVTRKKALKRRSQAWRGWSLGTADWGHKLAKPMSTCAAHFSVFGPTQAPPHPVRSGPRTRESRSHTDMRRAHLGAHTPDRPSPVTRPCNPATATSTRVLFEPRWDSLSKLYDELPMLVLRQSLS